MVEPPPVSRALSSLVAEARQEFQQRFGGVPRVCVAAPGRVNLIGEHVDYNGGFVLPMAIDRHVAIAASPIPGRVAHAVSTARPEAVDIPLEAALAPGDPPWANYLRGVLEGFGARSGRVPAFQALVHADLPLGGGLSSSAALEVATCLLLESLSGQALPAVERVRLCQKAEHTFAGVPCGIMDQFIVATAQRDHALLLDCQSLTARQVHFDGARVSLLVTHCGVAHELSKGEYANRRADCQRAAEILGVSSLRRATLEQLRLAGDRLTATERKRARHVITEIQRTVDFAATLECSDWPTAGRHMYASHQSLRDDYEVSCAELDLLVDLARGFGEAQGVFGARLTGGGFGGCMITLVRGDAAERIRQALADAYREQTGIDALSFVSPPVEGARRL